MLSLKRIGIVIVLLAFALQVNAQRRIPSYVISADVVYSAEFIPMLGGEFFSLQNNRLQSWHIEGGYQIKYNDQFNILFNQGDDISLGVYQGPVAKIGYSFYTKWRNRKWKNYYSPTLGLKYLWYDSMRVNTDQNWMNPAFRIQSEKCIALIPQFYWGQKRYSNHICFDYYFGFQLPVKFRDKEIYRGMDNYNVSITDKPFEQWQITAVPNIVFGIKIGFIQKKTLHKNEDSQ